MIGFHSFLHEIHPRKRKECILLMSPPFRAPARHRRGGAGGRGKQDSAEGNGLEAANSFAAAGHAAARCRGQGPAERGGEEQDAEHSGAAVAVARGDGQEQVVLQAVHQLLTRLPI